MRWRTLLCLLTIFPSSLAQSPSPADRHIDHFEISNRSRLAALSKVGFATATSLLVEAGDLTFLTEPISLQTDQKSISELIRLILQGPEKYTIRPQGPLLIVYPERPAQLLNRILKMPLGPFSFHGKSLSSLSPLISFTIRKATGCNPQGYAYAGPRWTWIYPPSPPNPLHSKTSSSR
jgi:hypothetical protein